jgi:hypothetical protein
MKSFRDLVKVEKIEESPVGSVGRTKDSEALAHIEGSDLAKKFRKIVRELGGKNVARQLLSGMNQKGETVTEGKMPKTMDPAKFLNELGYKIKNENYEKYSFEFTFFNSKDAKSAYKELTDEGFLELHNMTLVGSIIGFEEK